MSRRGAAGVKNVNVVIGVYSASGGTERLVSALKDQQAQIDSLKSQLASLKGASERLARVEAILAEGTPVHLAAQKGSR